MRRIVALYTERKCSLYRAERPGVLGKIRLFLAEDDQTLGESLVLWLENMNCDVTWARDGVEALQRVEGALETRSGSWSIAIIDVEMPQLDGHEFLSAVSQKAPHMFANVIIFSGKEKPSKTPYRWIQKASPCAIQKIKDAVEEILRN